MCMVLYCDSYQPNLWTRIFFFWKRRKNWSPFQTKTDACKEALIATKQSKDSFEMNWKFEIKFNLKLLVIYLSELQWICPNWSLLILYILTAGWRNKFKEDHWSWGRNLCSCEKKAWKIQACRYSNPDLVDYHCSWQTNWELQDSVSPKARKLFGPESKFKIKTCWMVAQFLAHKPVNSASLTRDSFIVSFSK